MKCRALIWMLLGVSVPALAFGTPGKVKPVQLEPLSLRAVAPVLTAHQQEDLEELQAAPLLDGVGAKGACDSFTKDMQGAVRFQNLVAAQADAYQQLQPGAWATELAHNFRMLADDTVEVEALAQEAVNALPEDSSPLERLLSVELDELYSTALDLYATYFMNFKTTSSGSGIKLYDAMASTDKIAFQFDADAVDAAETCLAAYE